METLSIDIETYSSADLARTGVYRYAQEPDFEVLLLAYSANGSAVRVIDLARGEELPVEVESALLDDGVTKWAYNASFERVCLSEWLRHRGNPPAVDAGVSGYLDLSSWRCSMVWAACRAHRSGGIRRCAMSSAPTGVCAGCSSSMGRAGLAGGLAVSPRYRTCPRATSRTSLRRARSCAPGTARQ